MEDDRISVLETQLSQARLIAEESDKKYEEVRVRDLLVTGLAIIISNSVAKWLLFYMSSKMSVFVLVFNEIGLKIIIN